jgi:hypothetical protein
MLKYIAVKVFVTDGKREKPHGSKNHIIKPTVWAVYLYGGRPPF